MGHKPTLLEYGALSWGMWGMELHCFYVGFYLGGSQDMNVHNVHSFPHTLGVRGVGRYVLYDKSYVLFMEISIDIENSIKKI